MPFKLNILSGFCFVILVLFNLQGAFRFVQSLDRTYIISYLFSLVKNFFQVFSTFFSQPLNQTAYISYHIQTRLSRTFFIYFLKLFSNPLSCDSLYILPHPYPFCQYLFSSFFQYKFGVLMYLNYINICHAFLSIPF